MKMEGSALEENPGWDGKAWDESLEDESRMGHW